MDKTSRVLIVDDMPINRMILSSLLASNGVLSDQAQSGRECLALCADRDYDLILLDHRMPDMDGVDTFVLLKDLFKQRGRSVPVICHTTQDGEKNINLYRAAGFADVLIKPIDPGQLSAVLMTYLPEEDHLLAEEEEILTKESMEPAEGAGEAGQADELDKLPVWLKTVPHIDLVAGIDNCGTAEDYLDALYVFYSSIEDKADEIEAHYNNNDKTMYTLRVHALKSLAGLVGARNLSSLAKTLEAAAREDADDLVRQNTPELLATYRDFIRLLKPLKDMERPVAQEPAPAPVQEAAPLDHCRTILFIRSNLGIVPTGIENQLQKAGFRVISIPDEPDRIITHRGEADIILYLPCMGEDSHIGITMNLLGEFCQDDSKILCLTGEPQDIKIAMAANGAYRVSRCYPRPVDIDQFVADMERYACLEQEYHRRKTIFVVDDDRDYLSVIERWFSDGYRVSCFSSGADLLAGLSAATPDLILLDYEMPEMDGYELMKSIRTGEQTESIPVIFLTGKNDREHVVRILEYKPDGYLLKSSRRDALLDAIRRFFAASLFEESIADPAE